jgi:hypothetical protein
MFSLASHRAVRRAGLFTSLVAGMAFSLFSASTAKAEWDPGPRMTQAVAAVLAGGQGASDKGFGYIEDTCFMAAFVGPGHSVAYDMPLNGGQTYLLLGGGERAARDVDIEVRNDRGELLYQDVDHDATPVVAFVAPRTAKYLITLKLVDRDRPRFCALAVLEKGGYTVPIDNLAQAADALLVKAERVDRAVNVAWHAGQNQWAIFGGVLRAGQSTTISNLNPGRADVVIVAVGDGVSKDIDLTVSDSGGSVLQQDLDPDAEPNVILRAQARESYQMTRKLVRTEGQRFSLVLTAILEVD